MQPDQGHARVNPFSRGKTRTTHAQHRDGAVVNFFYYSLFHHLIQDTTSSSFLSLGCSIALLIFFPGTGGFNRRGRFGKNASTTVQRNRRKKTRKKATATKKGPVPRISKTTKKGPVPKSQQNNKPYRRLAVALGIYALPRGLIIVDSPPVAVNHSLPPGGPHRHLLLPWRHLLLSWRHLLLSWRHLLLPWWHLLLPWWHLLLHRWRHLLLH